MMPQDLDQVCAIEQETFSKPWSRASFQNAMEDPANLYMVACEGQQILGYCGLWSVVGEGQISNVAVRRSCRGQGIGTKMLLEFLALGKERGNQSFTLEVRKSNLAARKLYERCGFQEEGVRKAFYEDPVEDGIIMWKREEERC